MTVVVFAREHGWWQALDGCDLDHDGEINYAEFMKMLR